MELAVVHDMDQAALLVELGQLAAELVERELELASLAGRLQAFSIRYLRTVGAKMAELDRLRARLAEARARRDPLDSQAQGEADAAREYARSTEEAANQAAREPASAQRFEPSPGLKTLYRRVVKRFHPDLGRGAEDVERRTRFMQRANIAYQAGDEDALEALLAEWERSEAPTPRAETDRPARVEAEVASCRARLRVIAEEIQALRNTEMCTLMERAAEAEAEGHDLLADLLRVTELDIQLARDQLEAVNAT